jgi:hypothetical protein
MAVTDDAFSALVDHVTRFGSEADDALRAKLFELSGGKHGSAPRGTEPDPEDADTKEVTTP